MSWYSNDISGAQKNPYQNSHFQFYTKKCSEPNADNSEVIKKQKKKPSSKPPSKEPAKKRQKLEKKKPKNSHSKSRLIKKAKKGNKKVTKDNFI